MNGLIVVAWLIYGPNSGIAIPYDSMAKCEQAAIAARRDQSTRFSIYPLCVPGNAKEAK